MDWVCNACEKPLPTKQAVIAHYRKNHPKDGWGLWDICGTTGDAFADTAANEIWQRFKDCSAKLRDAEVKVVSHEDLVERWNALCRAVRIGHEAMDAYRSAYEKPEKSK